MGKELDIDDVVAGHPTALAELARLRKAATRYYVIRQDHEGSVLPDLALYAGRALDDYIDAAIASMGALGSNV